MSIHEIYKQKDIILLMIFLYVISTLNKSTDKQKDIRELDRKLAGAISSYESGKATKIAIANALSISIAKSFKLNDFVLISAMSRDIFLFSVMLKTAQPDEVAPFFYA